MSSIPLGLSVKRAPVAQRTERVASDHQVAGSIPAGRAIANFSGSASDALQDNDRDDAGRLSRVGEETWKH